MSAYIGGREAIGGRATVDVIHTPEFDAVCEWCGVTWKDCDDIEEIDGTVICPPCNAIRVTESAYECGSWQKEQPKEPGVYWWKVGDMPPFAVRIPNTIHASLVEGMWWPWAIVEPPI